MRRVLGYVVTSVISVLIGGAIVAFLVRHRNDREDERRYMADLFFQAYSAREIYAGRADRLADHIRDSLPERVLAVEKEFKERQGRDGAYRMVLDVYDVSKVEVPVSIRSTLASVPRRPYGLEQTPGSIKPTAR